MELVTLMERWEITRPNSAGIISELYDIYNSTANDDEELTIPFIPSEMVSVRLNSYYYFGWSGDKYSSPMVERYQQLAESPVVWQVEVAKTFWEVHGDELLRQWELFQKEYDPLASYDVHESTDYVHDASGDIAHTGDDSTSRTGTVTTTDSVWGVNVQNSSAGKNTDKSIVDYGTGDGLKNKTTYNNNRHSTDYAIDDLDTHKYGNLGTMPLTKLIKDDIELWAWDFYTKFFFPAIDSMIALPIY